MRLTRPGAAQVPDAGHEPAARSRSAICSGVASLIHAPMPDSEPARNFELPRCPAQREQLQVQPGEVASGVDRRLVPSRDVGQLHGLAEHPLQAVQEVAVQHGQLVALGVVERRDVGHRTVRHQVRLDRPTRRRGHEARPRLAVEHHAAARFAFAVEDVAEQVAARALPVRRRTGEQLRGARRDERVAVDLPVRVLQRDPDLLPAVLEREHLLDAGQRGQRGGAVGPRLDHRAHPRHRQRPERRRCDRW